MTIGCCLSQYTIRRWWLLFLLVLIIYVVNIIDKVPCAVGSAVELTIKSSSDSKRWSATTNKNRVKHHNNNIAESRYHRSSSSSTCSSSTSDDENDDERIIRTASTKTIIGSKDDDGVVTDLKYILDNLSDHELESAARTSYEYSTTSGGSSSSTKKHQNNETVATDILRNYYATQMVQRYLKSHDRDRALTMIRETLKFRQEIDIEQLVTAPINKSHPDYEPLRTFLGTKKAYVQGYDKDGRSTYVFIPRNVRNHDLDLTRKTHIWTMERAIACSKAPDKSVNAIVDFHGFSASANTPPFEVGKDLMSMLKNHYSGYLHGIYLINAPFAFVCIWKIFKQFTTKDTASKIHFINRRQGGTTTDDNNNKNDININRLQQLYAADQVPSWILPSGTKNRELDIDEYLDKIPFHQAFDE